MENQDNWRVTRDWLKSEKYYLKQKQMEIEKEGLTIKEKLAKLQNK